MSVQQSDFIGAAGHRLSGRLDLPDGPARGYALFAHCFTCTKNSLAASRIARALTALGIGVFRFDFTGLGDSGGDFADATLSGDVRDLSAAVDHMTRQGFPPRLLIGHSLGGAAVLAAAGHLPEIAAVAVIGAPFDARHVTALFKDVLPEILDQGEAQVDLGGRPFTIRRSFIDDLRSHDQGARIAELHRPLLILHSPVDQTVGVDNAAAIFQAARHPKSYVSLDNADHLLTRAADAEYAAGVIAAWATRYLDTPAGHATARGTAAPAATHTPGYVPGHVEVRETGVGGLQVAVTAGGVRFLADEPVANGGLGSGPDPYELLGAALGACTAMTLRLYANHKQWPLTGLRVTVGHTKDKELSPADHFRREIHVEGPLDDEQRARLLEIAERCPVHRTLTNGSTVETTMAPRPRAATDTPAQHAADPARTRS